MKEPGLDQRHRDQNGRIELKHGNAQNGNLSNPVQGFRRDATVQHMRDVTGQNSLAGIRQAARRGK